MNESKRGRVWQMLVVGLVLLPLLYVLSYGPAQYGRIREWLPSRVDVAYIPMREAVNAQSSDGWLRRYLLWWTMLGIRHEGHSVIEVDGRFAIRSGTP